MSSTASSGENSFEDHENDSLGITKGQAQRAGCNGVDVKYDPDSGMYLYYDSNTGTIIIK